jgi:hypothetical protein
MSEFADYKASMNAKIANIMTKQVSEEVRKEIKTQADALVYSGATSDYRESLSDPDNYHDTYYQNGDTHILEVEASHTFQGAPWGNYLSTVVEHGWKNWRQPGPRPYMKTAERNMQEKVGGIVAAALNSKGL